jgi:holo-[acyl-carrier protein] synthase
MVHTWHAMRALSIGLDVVDIREVKASLEQFGDRYLTRVYAAEEIAYAVNAPADTARRLGARFAAKEATIKALRAGEDGIDLRTIEVRRARDGSCQIELSGNALRVARRTGVVSLSVSMTHQGDIAAAVVIAERVASAGRSRTRRARATRAEPR